MGKEFSLTREQIVFYRKNGYLVVDGILSGKKCDYYNAIFEKHARKDRDTEFKGIMNKDREDPQVRKLMKHPKVVKILDTLQGSQPGGVVGIQSMFLFKKAHTRYSNQAWNPHQDNAYPKAPWGHYLTGNIPFADQDPENGGMYIFPGSHFEGLLEAELMQSHHEKKGKKPGHDVSKSLPEEYWKKKTDLYLKRGSVLILHGNVVHGSYPNKSNRDRPMFLIPYGTEFITKQKGWIVGENGQRYSEIPLHD